MWYCGHRGMDVGVWCPELVGTRQGRFGRDCGNYRSSSLCPRFWEKLQTNLLPSSYLCMCCMCMCSVYELEFRKVCVLLHSGTLETKSGTVHPDLNLLIIIKTFCHFGFLWSVTTLNLQFLGGNFGKLSRVSRWGNGIPVSSYSWVDHDQISSLYLPEIQGSSTRKFCTPGSSSWTVHEFQLTLYFKPERHTLFFQ